MSRGIIRLALSTKVGHFRCPFLIAPINLIITIHDLHIMIYRSTRILVAASTLFSFGLTAQKGLQSNPVIHVKKTDESITIDGRFDESIWKSTIPAKNFLQNFPVDSLLATYDTEVHMAYDEQNLYVLIKCYASDNSFVIPSLRRDFGFFGNDNITILFDTYKIRMPSSLA